MRFEASDIEIFVLTYNRASLLPATLRSLLAQSAEGASITVLDNASDDTTSSVIKPFLDIGVHYSRAESNLGWEGNLRRAQCATSRAWTMVFHDDDLLHPFYLQYALQAMDAIPALGLILSTMSFEATPQEDGWLIKEPRKVLCTRVEGLASLLYSGMPIHFGSAIYRSDIFKALKWESDRYGKVGDRPFLLSAAEAHATQVFSSPLVRYRIHAQQDSASTGNGPFVSQLAQLHRCYRGYLGENPLSKHGICFLRNNYSVLRDEFAQLPVTEKLRFESLRGYQSYVLAQGGCSRLSLFLGLLAFLCKRGILAFARVLRPVLRCCRLER